MFVFCMLYVTKVIGPCAIKVKNIVPIRFFVIPPGQSAAMDIVPVNFFTNFENTGRIDDITTRAKSAQFKLDNNNLINYIFKY